MAASGQGGFRTGLLPTATISGVKDASNPTFNFACLPESITKVGATYYAAYITTTEASEVRLATASDRDGPWTDAGAIFAFTSIPWRASTVGLYAPFIMEDAGTFYLFYSLIVAAGATDATNAIGVATASAITGTYTDSGSAILAPGAGAAWDSRRVGECDVINQGGTWVMAYMGETSAATLSTSEKVGIATAASPTGPWTKAAGNPLIDFGTSGQWDDALIADPNLIYINGYYWIMYAGGIDSNPTTRAEQGLAYAATPTGPFTRYAGNPILTVGSGGTWDDVWVFRGALIYEDGSWSGIYCGYDGANFKGGNFLLSITN